MKVGDIICLKDETRIIKEVRGCFATITKLEHVDNGQLKIELKILNGEYKDRKAHTYENDDYITLMKNKGKQN